jgi:hypothetical protein
MGNVSKIMTLLRYIRDKFDLEYLYLKLMAEDEDEVSTQQDEDEEAEPEARRPYWLRARLAPAS